MTGYGDALASSYERYKETATLVLCERALFRRLTGDVTGLSAVDVACGTGYYTRDLRVRGADPVTGIDLSPRMIELAEDRERRERLGIAYAVGDGSALPDRGRYDLATAAYLFPYATDEETLAAMMASLRGCMHPGGRLVTLTVDPEFRAEPDLADYGWTAARFSGRQVTMRFSGDPPADLTNTLWPRSTVVRVARAAGFTEMAWHPLEVPGEELERYGAGYWSALMENPFIEGFTAVAR
ncbi:hypothetical protein Afil01_42080 [Actinorhabdospora filicis]|uniref:Methyltransferase domain-containing protein n=1 Tax=Actinorhabdospora filicis TaxID=1785913 RepID=A0A9W6WBB5_9ACTN|nr:class I SAM-dependent methyltransferase [Actinorhabdospora filicis]GLZ79401.1 hypothetical protein Afil01_42080 [Actinorhabdospora filicis]